MRFRAPKLTIDAEKNYDLRVGETLTLVMPFEFLASGPIGTMKVEADVRLRCKWDGETLTLLAPGIR